MNRYEGPGCGGFFNFCNSLDYCDQLVFLTDMGLKYSKSELTISDELKSFTDFQNKILLPARNIRDNAFNESVKMFAILDKEIDKQKEVDSLIYKIERVKLTDRKTIFHIRCDAPDYNETISLSDVNFQTKQNVPDSLFKVEWDYCKLTTGSKNKFNLLLQVKGSKLKLQGLKMIFIKGGAKNTKQDLVFNSYRKQLKEREKRSIEIGDSISIIQLEYDALLKIYSDADSVYKDQIAKLYSKNIEDFNCFWSLSKNYMSDEEAGLTFEKWILFFDNHKEMMGKRYQKIKSDSKTSYDNCRKMSVERADVLNEIYAVLNYGVNVTSDSLKPARDTVIIPLSISELGIYNTAVPVFFGNANLGRVGCYLLNKDTVNIARAIFIDENYNSYFEVNGSFNFSPYLFPTSYLTAFRIIAFDEKGLVYVSAQIDKAKNVTSKTWYFNSIELFQVKTLKALNPLFKSKN